MLLAWRFSRTFASRFNFANVVFFLPATVDLQVVPANRGPGRHDGDALSTVFRPADARPRPERLAAATPDAPSAQRAEAPLPRQGRPRMLERRLQQRPSTGRPDVCPLAASRTLIAVAAAPPACQRVPAAASAQHGGREHCLARQAAPLSASRPPRRDA